MMQSHDITAIDAEMLAHVESHGTAIEAEILAQVEPFVAGEKAIDAEILAQVDLILATPSLPNAVCAIR